MPRLVYRGLFAIAIKMSNKVLLTVNGLCGNHLLNAHDEGFNGGLDGHVCMYILQIEGEMYTGDIDFVRGFSTK